MFQRCHNDIKQISWNEFRTVKTFFGVLRFKFHYCFAKIKNRSRPNRLYLLNSCDVVFFIKSFTKFCSLPKHCVHVCEISFEFKKYCSKSVLFKKWELLEITKTCPKPFFHNLPCLRKHDLIRLTPYHWQNCISQFCDITKDTTLQKFSKTKKSNYQLVAVSRQ